MWQEVTVEKGDVMSREERTMKIGIQREDGKKKKCRGGDCGGREKKNRLHEFQIKKILIPINATLSLLLQVVSVVCLFPLY